MLRQNRSLIYILGIIACMASPQLMLGVNAQCGGGTSVTQPVTVDDESSNVPNSRQLVNGVNTTVDTSTAGQIKVSLPTSGVSAGSYTSTNLTVNSEGVITAASNGSGGGSVPALPSGQIYVGNSSSAPVATTPTAGTGLSVSAGSGSLQYSLSAPVATSNGGTGITTTPTTGQLLIGTSGGGYSVANLTAGSNVTISNTSGGITISSSGGGGGGGVSSVNAGTETTIGGTSSAPTVNVQFATNATLTANTSLAVGTIYPCSTSSGGFTATLPDATASGNQGAHVAVFLKTAGNALSIATTSSQLVNGQSAPISVSNANTLLLFLSDGTNWQCVPMQPATAQTSNQWVAYIDALGVQHTAQVSFSNLSGSISAAQMPSLASGQIYVGNGSNVNAPELSSC